MKAAIPPVLALLMGLVLGFGMFYYFDWHIPAVYAPYLSVAALAGFDTVFGGLRASFEGRFQTDIFASGFVLNALLAAGLAWFGKSFGVDLGLVAVIVLGMRIFNNLSLMRRFYINNIAQRRRLVQEAAALNSLPVPVPQIGTQSETSRSI